MLPEELLKKVRLIEITTRKMVDDSMSGQYKSHFKGHGVQFSEHRQYIPGDDVRHIDWKASARMRDPVIKKYDEERELTVFLVVDVSASKAFGSHAKLKAEMAAEVCGMLAYAATHTGDKVGMLLFAGEVERIVPPKKGRKHVLRIIRDLLTHEPRTQGTDLGSALESAGRMMKNGGIVFVVSDFIAEGYELALKKLASKHDLVAIQISDPRETDIPDVGILTVWDPESGVERMVDTGSYAFKAWLERMNKLAQERQQSLFRSRRVEHLKIFTSEDYGEALVRFFRARARRRR